MRSRRTIFIILAVAATLAVAFAFFSSRQVSIDDSAALAKKVPKNGVTLPEPVGGAANAEGSLGRSPFTGIDCAGEALGRPVAVMLSGDTIARPLSGLASADIVVEMPVVTSSITRLMAVFTCASTLNVEVGSIRSSRDDYIPLAAGFDAIYAHWGGSHFALDELKQGVLQNLDALRNPSGAFYRKKGAPAPHNGFTTLARLRDSSAKLGYRMTINAGVEYPHEMNIPQGAIQKVGIGYLGQFRVEWRFDSTRHAFLRWRGGSPEIDRAKSQVVASTLIIMRTDARQIEGQYNDVRVVGSGGASVYRNGGVVHGRWEKAPAPLNAPLKFFDAEGKEIPFASGPIWLEIVQQDTVITEG